jgi:hypothetical protein
MSGREGGLEMREGLITALRRISRALAVLLIGAAVGAAVPLPQASATVEGRVTSTVNGQAVRKATVTVRQSVAAGGAAAETYVCETGADGRFSIAGVAPGAYEASAMRTGFEGRPARRAAPSGALAEFDAAAGQHVTGIEIHLVPEGVIAGKVLGPEGDPMPRVNVQTLQYRYISGKRQLGPMQGAMTDDRGEFRIFGLPAGRYYLRATANFRRGALRFSPQEIRRMPPTGAYGPVLYPNAIDVGRASPLDLAPGGELTGIDFRLTPAVTYSIRGKVAGDPQGNWSIMARRRSNDDPSMQMNSGAQRMNDTYEVPGLTPGSYVVTAQLFEPVTPGTGGPSPRVEARMFARQVVEVVNQDVEGIDLVFAPGAQLSGKIKVEGSTPVPLTNIRVMLQADDPYAGGGAQTMVNADGSFVLPSVAPDQYRVRVNAGGAYVKSVKIGDRDIPDGRIDAQSSSGGLILILSAETGSVTGSVTGEDGKPSRNVNVTLIPDQRLPDWEQRFQNSFTDIKGMYNFRGVEPGEYRLFAWYDAEPGAPQSVEFRKPYEDQGIVVKVAPNGSLTVPLKGIRTAN